jgi:hypothetical protein
MRYYIDMDQTIRFDQITRPLEPWLLEPWEHFQARCWASVGTVLRHVGNPRECCLHNMVLVSAPCYDM